MRINILDGYIPVTYLSAMTRLGEYLKDNQIRQKDFASLLACSQVTISRLAAGQGRPGLDLAISISRVTEGAVPVEGWSTPPPPVATPPEQTSEDAA